MTIRRSVTRREFTVRTAGWFTVLKPDGWYPALRLPRRFHDRRDGSLEIPGIAARCPELANAPQIMMPTTEDHRLMRPAMIALTAMMITSGLLWWIMHP